MAVSQNHNELPGTSLPFSSFPSHPIKALASLVMSAKGVIFFFLNPN